MTAPDPDLARRLRRRQSSYVARMADSHNSIVIRSPEDELAECYRLMHSAADVVEQHQRLLDAIGDPLTLLADNVDLDERLRRIAAAVEGTEPAPADHDGHTINLGPVTVLDRCPTCGSDDPEIRRTTRLLGSLSTGCPDPWHSAPTEGDETR